MLSGVAQSAYKMCGDVRLLANLKEVEEPFAKTQVCVACAALLCSAVLYSLAAGRYVLDFGSALHTWCSSVSVAVSLDLAMCLVVCFVSWVHPLWVGYQLDFVLGVITGSRVSA